MRKRWRQEIYEDNITGRRRGFKGKKHEQDKEPSPLFFSPHSLSVVSLVISSLALSVYDTTLYACFSFVFCLPFVSILYFHSLFVKKVTLQRLHMDSLKDKYIVRDKREEEEKMREGNKE